MQFKIKLSTKLICMIAGALLFESVFWLTIQNLKDTAARNAAESANCTEIVNKIDSISRRALDIVATGADPEQTPDEGIIAENVLKLQSEFKSLESLVPQDSEKASTVRKAADAAQQHIQATLALRSRPHVKQVDNLQEIDPIWAEVQNHELAVISDDLKELRANESKRGEKLRDSQIQIRHQVNDFQIACLCFKAFALLLFVFFVAKKLTDRLNWITAVLLLQLAAFVILLFNLQQQSDEESRRNIQALKTVNAIKEINSYFQEINATIFQNALVQSANPKNHRIGSHLAPEAEDDMIARFMDKRNLVGFHYTLLKESTKTDPEKLSTIESSKEAADRTFSLLEQMHRLLEEEVRNWHSQAIENNSRRQASWRQIQSDIKDTLSINFLSIMNHELDQTLSSPKQQEWLRQQINTVLIAECLIILACLSFIALTVRGVTKRVNIMSDNAVRLASDLPLNPPVDGKDEISALDQTFHTMAQSLKEATNTERAILQNASEVICSIGDTGHFSAVNPASLSVFGYSPDEMFGKLFVDFLFKDDMGRVVDAIEKLKAGGEAEPIEARFVKKDGALIDTLWSATWSSAEKTVFCVIHDITERKEVERMKQEVVEMITHDLRTPLSTIRNFHEMLSTGLLGELSAKAEKMLVLAERNSGRMLSLINDLLDVEKIKAGMMELTKEEVSAGKVLEHTAQSLSALAAESGVSLVTKNNGTSKTDNLTFHGDEDKISRVVTNLVSNAIKFSPRDTAITLSVESVNGNVHFKVKDQGRGIPQDKIANIFDRFQQVTAQDHAKAGGSGLGLAICKAIVELHGGEISVESTEGEGSTFKFSIPRESKS